MGGAFRSDGPSRGGDRRQALPDDLELMPPGPALCALLASAVRSSLSDKDRVRLLRARNRLAAHLQGELLADIYAVSLEDDPDEDAMAKHAAPSRYPWATTEVAFALTWTETAAGARLEQARQLIEDLPQVFDALRDGRLDMPKVLVICELASWLESPAAGRRLVAEVIDRAPGWTTGQLRARLRQLVLAVDPQAARRRCVSALRTRRVESFPNPDGTGEVWGRSLPPQDAAAAWERLTAIARAAKAAGDDRTLDQLRADALLDLLVGEGVATGGPVGRHLAGLPEADGPPGGSPDRHCSAVAATRPAREATAPTWDPAWPAEPDDRLTASQVWPHPAGPPLDRFDDDGEAFDGAQAWPPDWPGRWVDDAAVTAARRSADITPPATITPTATATTSSAPSGALPGPRRGTVELLLPLSTALGHDDLPGELLGWGPVIADIARHIAAEQHGAQWRFSAYNRIGELEHHGRITARPAPASTPAASPARPISQPPASQRAQPPEVGRRPSAAVAARVRARNRTCTAPGCRIPARTCDLDHTVDWAKGGPTSPLNLGPTCRRHHRYKHESGARLWQLDPGDAFVWTTRRGLQYLTKPDAPLLDRGRWGREPKPPDTS